MSTTTYGDIALQLNDKIARDTIVRILVDCHPDMHEDEAREHVVFAGCLLVLYKLNLT